MALLAVEFDIFAFVEMRYRELGIDDDHGTLFDQAAVLRIKMDKHRANRFYAASLGSVMAVLGIGPLVEGARLLSFDVPSVVLCMAFVGAAGWLWRFWFQGERARRFPETKEKGPLYEIDGADAFAKVLEPVRSGLARLALISNSGEARHFTPVSNRPIEKYISGNALNDAWLPGEVLHRPNPAEGRIGHIKKSSPEYIVIFRHNLPVSRKRPTEKWKSYYLWHQDPKIVADAFDEAKSIYPHPDEEIKRLKVRIAILLVCEHFTECKQTSAAPLSQPKLAKMLKDRLEYEAALQLSAAKISDVEARKLSRLSLPGDQKSHDPADPRAGLHDKPESWFLSLLSGTHDQSLPYLRVAMLARFPTLPEFIDN